MIKEKTLNIFVYDEIKISDVFVVKAKYEESVKLLVEEVFVLDKYLCVHILARPPTLIRTMKPVESSEFSSAFMVAL